MEYLQELEFWDMPGEEELLIDELEKTRAAIYELEQKRDYIDAQRKELNVCICKLEKLL